MMLAIMLFLSGNKRAFEFMLKGFQFTGITKKTDAYRSYPKGFHVPLVKFIIENQPVENKKIIH